MDMYTNRTVVITGAGGGIGALLVRRFVANGDTVIATDVSDAALSALRDHEIDAERLLVEAADVTSTVDTDRLAGVAGAASGGVDVLINCAGYFPIVEFESMSTDDWQRVLDINLTGPFRMVRSFLPLMKGRGWGRIINFGSGSVFDGTPGQAHYVAAKAGVVGFSRSLAREVGRYGITVNIITPGLTVTKAVRDTFPAEILAGQRQRRAIGRDQIPEDLVGPVFFLASPDADFVSGQTLKSTAATS